MLLNLHIENVAIIKKSDIDFSNGFTVLTGETGAGKSIIIDSINILLGNKGNKNLISTGAEFAFVSAVFSDFNDFQKSVLAQSNIFPDEDGNVIISRKITIDGRSYSKINDVNVTVTTLKSISDVLVNIHGQHDGAKILNPSTHISYLDDFCDNSNFIDDYFSKYKDIKSIRERIVRLTEIKNKREQLEETLRFKIDELEKAQIKEGELNKLKESSAIAQNMTAVLQALGFADNVISGENGAIDSISAATEHVLKIEKVLEPAKKISETLIRAKAELEDASELISRELSQYDGFDVSPDYIEQRIYSIEKIISKYGSETAALSSLEQFKNELARLEDNESELIEASEQYQKALIELENKAEKLSEIRKKGADKLSLLICEQLKELDMPSVKFETSITRNRNSRGGNKYTSIGFDCVEFLISPNSGQQLKPLSKIASGGELSRIMLCLKSILNSSKIDCDTIIYDEVDSGVSGSTAQKIGFKLKNSAKDKQVFSITHLAQIAAIADNHYKVEKQTIDNETVSKIRKLSDDDRIYEVARIMGGVEISEQILSSAKELINNSKMC